MVVFNFSDWCPPSPIRYFCTYAPRCSRLNISLKKNTTTLKFDLDLPVAVFKAMVFAKKIFSNRKGPFKCYVTLFPENWTPTHPLVTLITLNFTPSYRFFPENLTHPHPHRRYVTLEWPRSILFRIYKLVNTGFF